MSFQTDIEDYVGSFSDTAALTIWLTAAAKKILDMLPEEVIERYASAVAITNGTTSLAEYRILSIIRESVKAQRVEPAMFRKYKDPNSLMYAHELSPVWTLIAGVVNAAPPTGTGAAATALMGLNTTLTIAAAGTNYEAGDTFTTLGGTNPGTATTHCVITVTSVHPSTGGVTGVTVTTVGSYSALPTIPATLTDGGNLTTTSSGGSGAEFTVTWGVVGSTVSSGGSGYSSSFPPFVIYSAGSAQATATVSSTGVVSAVTPTIAGAYLAIPTISFGNLTAYAVAYPSIAYSDSTASGFPPKLHQALVLDVAIKAAIRKAFESLAVSSAITSFSNIAVPLTAPTLPAWTDASISSTYAATTIGSLPASPVYTPPVPDGAVSTALSSSSTALSTDEDIELSEGHLSRGKTALEQYQLDIQRSLQSFNGEVAVYNAGVQKVLEQARLTQEYLLTKAKTETDLNLQNEMQEVATEIQNYQLELGRYQADIQLYSAQVNAEATKLATLLQKSSQESQNYLAMIPLLKAEYGEYLNIYIQGK